MANAFVFPNKRQIRSMPNIYDKSTIVSIYPRKVIEKNHTIQPGVFEIEAGSKDNPSILVVGQSSWWKDMHQEDSVLEIPTGSNLVADSVVNDFCRSVHGYSDDKGPGLFSIPGRALKVEDIKNEFKAELTRADLRQRRWYEELVTVANTFWTRTGGNPRAIDDLMRLAAKELQLKDIPWMSLEQQVQLVNCPYCGTMRKTDYPICAACHHVVDKKLYEKLNPQKVAANG